MHWVELPFNQETPFLTKSEVNRPFLPLRTDDGSMTTSVESFFNICMYRKKLYKVVVEFVEVSISFQISSIGNLWKPAKSQHISEYHFIPRNVICYIWNTIDL